MEYNFRKIEEYWQSKWKEEDVYTVSNDSSKPKYYVLDMFPYPSGAGLHVGHPLGYIASDIFARYKRLKGFNVLHPMGYDAFGLPAEQYAIEHGIHPAVSTEQNIKNFRAQLDKIGFCFDWSREVNTSKPEYYKWTQWIFLQLFKSFYNRIEKKADNIENLIKKFEKEGNVNHPMPVSSFQLPVTSIRQPASGNQFTPENWNSFDEKTQQTILMEYRLAYCGYGEVNWCEALGTVLANDEVINGVSERGGYPVVKKKLRQWYLRITEYADRLLEGLEQVEFSEAMKEMQTNWIGKSYGAEIDFEVASPLTPLLEERGADETQLSGNHFKMADKNFWGQLKEHGRQNRKEQTGAEEILWQRVRNNQLGYKVRRQHAISGFIVDFAFMQQHLIVEIDGGYHDEEEQKKYDESRSQYLTQLGYKILRFSNNDIANSIDEVIEKIKQNFTEASLSARRGAGGEAVLKVYTTRPDTIFGVDFMVIAPEHELISSITTKEQEQAVEEYIAYVKSRSDRERQAEKKITGVFTGAYAINPFNKKEIPIWISEYVLAGYGTGAIMGVPCGDERDFKFAKHFNIPITNIIGKNFNGEEANPTKDAILENSDFLNGVLMRDAIEIVNNKIEELGIGKKKVNYKMRDAAFSRQRYWGEPFPIVWKDGIAYPLDEKDLPLQLPELDEIKPGKDGEGPLANIESWISLPSPRGEGLGVRRESSTMPGYAGSSWYFLRYMDPHNDKEFCDRKASDYWNQVDLYIGGTEHAVGHLLYSRMWTKFLFDINQINFDEPYKKLVNQGMITGISQMICRFDGKKFKEGLKFPGKSYPYSSSMEYGRRKTDKDGMTPMKRFLVTFDKAYVQYFSSDFDVLDLEDMTQLHVPIFYVDDNNLDLVAYTNSSYWNKERDSVFICNDGYFLNGQWYDFYHQPIKPLNFKTISVGEKMSKSKLNFINPDDLVMRYGADTFRMYEMFLGPVEQSKPWDTKGIEGVHRFLKKLWRLFYDENAPLSARRGAGGEAEVWNNETPNDAELKILHKAIKKIEEDTERFSFNTGVSAFMIAVNDLSDLKCHKKEILEPLLILLTPYAPHICEDLWRVLGNESTILNATYPKAEKKYLVESAKNYPIAINGRTRAEINISLDATQQQVEEIILANETVKKWLEGKQPKKIIYVKNKMINVVI